MALSRNTNWANTSLVDYSGAAVWGTGIDPIHAFYGGPPVRVEGRFGNDPDVTPPSQATAQYVEVEPPWGYQPDDINGLDVFADPVIAIKGIPFMQDGWPDWTETTPQTRATSSRQNIYPVGSPGVVASVLRGLRIGPRDQDSEVSNEVPTETVSEGWENKPKGSPANSVPSDPSQYERQTSMQQRYRARNNRHAVARSTDDERTPIDSRVTGQKIKMYSGKQRHYDMSPYQQDQMNRPFWYRTAATGPQYYLEPMEMYVSEPITRTPPPDPSMGETDTNLDYGYTPEDYSYA